MAQKKAKQVQLSNSEVIPAQGKLVGGKKEIPMGFQEAVKRSSVTDWCITAFTLVLSVVAVYQYFVMGNQLDTMKKDQRPWLRVTLDLRPTVDPKAPKIFGIVRLLNSGKTPAKVPVTALFTEKVSNGDQPKLPQSGYGFSNTTGIIYPNDPVPIPGVTFYSLSSTEYDDFVNGRIFFVIYGVTTYQDFFGTAHWSKFCQAETGSLGGFTAKKCTDYNDADDY